MITVTIRLTAAVDFPTGELVYPKFVTEIHLLPSGNSPVLLHCINGSDLAIVDAKKAALAWILANVAPSHQTKAVPTDYVFGREKWPESFKSGPEII